MENKITVKEKQRYFKLNRCFRSIKASLLLGPMGMLFFWYVCIPGTFCTMIWKDIILMVSIGWIVSVIYVVFLWFLPVNLEQKRKKLQKKRNKGTKELQEKTIIDLTVLDM